MKTIALKVDVDTLRGTSQGVPRLLNLFKKHNVHATFLFSLGPDHTGWAMKRIFRPGFFSKVQRTSVLSHYGLKTLLYGVLLPAPHIGLKAAETLRLAKAEGFEVGIHTYDHVYWQDNVFKRDASWTSKQMELARKTFLEIFEQEPQTHGAAGWQMNPFAFEWINRFDYSSDTRGEFPFYPQVSGKTLKCMQLPTTLPTMDEVLGLDGVTEENIANTFLKLTSQEKEFGHVFTLHAELEGMKLLNAMELFIVGLKKQNYEIVSMGELFKKIENQKVPTCELDYSSIPGRSGNLYRQGKVISN
jgi:undecaprenyl phosphate-alpha-L-ara4FN deformylase